MKQWFISFFTVVLCQPVFAVDVHYAADFSNVREWRLTGPLPEKVTPSSERREFSVTIHVNRIFHANNKTISDLVELTCGERHVFLKPGATGNCHVTPDSTVFLSIPPAFFKNGAEGTLTF